MDRPKILQNVARICNILQDSERLKDFSFLQDHDTAEKITKLKWKTKIRITTFRRHASMAEAA